MIALLTDSTCDLPADIMEKHQIEVIPLTVNFSEKSYQDKIDLESKKFYSMMESAVELPRTSQPAAGLFIEKYKKLGENYDQIISIHISSALSGTCESARLAASELENLEIEVIDSKLTSTGLGFLVLLAAEMIEAGKNINEIKEKIISAINNITVYFTVNELTYLEKGGRIGKTQAFLGNVFNFNPILELSPVTGKISPKEKVRGNKKTNQKMVELALKAVKNSKKVSFAYLYGRESKNYNQFKELLEAELQGKNNFDYKIIANRIGAVLTSHTGPLVYGIVIYRGELLGR